MAARTAFRWEQTSLTARDGSEEAGGQEDAIENATAVRARHAARLVGSIGLMGGPPAPLVNFSKPQIYDP
jgi:hypothetical protein